MKRSELSIEYQIRAGTKERNDRIRQSYKLLVELVGKQGALSVIGRKQTPILSRQRIWQIINRK